MTTTLRRPNSRLSFADEVSYRDSPTVPDLDNSFPENFIIGDRVWLNGIYGARIQYIGEVHFAHGDDWAGLVLDEPVGKHDGAIGGHRYYYCENKRGLFARLSKLTRVPLRAQESSPNTEIQTNSNSPRPPIRQRHYSSPSSILKNSPNRTYSNKSTTPTLTQIKQSPTFKRNYFTPKDTLDRSYEYYEYNENQNKSERNLNRSTGSSDILNLSESRSSPFSSSSYNSSRSQLTSPSLLNYHYGRQNRSSTPKFQNTTRSLSTGSRQPRIHHIKVELEPENLDFKRNLKKACSEDITKGDKPLLTLGDLVYVDSSRGLLSGKLRYLGPTDFKEGHWAGIELDLPYGRHNGKVEGKRYFTCKANHGLFAPCTRVFKQRRVDSNKQIKSTRFADDV